MSNQSALISLPGEYPVHPIVLIRPTAVRPSPSAALGWRYRRRYRIVNTTDERLINAPYAIDLGPTNALVSGGKALASGNDLRVWRDGVEIRRTLNTWNGAGAVGSTTSTLVWVAIDDLQPGASQDYEVVYGNASAGAPSTLVAGDDAPIFDVATTGATRSSNAFWLYRVDRVAADAGLGLWYLSSGTVQPEAQMVAPGAWQAANTKPSPDARRQLTYESYVATGTKYHATLAARRGRAGAQIGQEGIGGDGVQVHHPGGIVSVRASFTFLNPAINTGAIVPLAQLVVIGKRSAGGDWLTIASNPTLYAVATAIAAATYTMPGAAAKDIALAVWPYGSDIVDPSARGDIYAEALLGSTCELNVTSPASQTLQQAETEIVEAGYVSRVGGGFQAVTPYRYVGVGNWEGATAQGARRSSLKADGTEVLKIDNDRRSVTIVDNTTGALIETVPYGAYDGYDVRTIDGIATTMIASEWLTLTPVINPLTNPSAETDALNWVDDTAAGESTGMTVGAIGRTTSTPDSGAGAFTRAISASTAAAGKLARAMASDYVPIGGVESVQIGAALRTTNLNLRPVLCIAFYDANLSLLSRAMQDDAVSSLAAINAWERHVFAASVPSGAVYWRAGVLAKDMTGSQTGTIGWDTVELGGPEVIITDAIAGPKSVTVTAEPRYAYA